jgi:hypothetical protein
MGAFVEGELHLDMDEIFSYLIQFLFTLCLISLSFKIIARGHCLDMVTSGDSVTHKHFMEMRRLTRDETPFLSATTPRYTTLAW